MSYFPLFLNIENKKFLIIGGGRIAFLKLRHMLDFTKNISLISKEFNKEMLEYINELQLKYSIKEYEEKDLNGYDIIIVAIDDYALQEKIYFQAKKKNCICNCVDLQQYCDFIFPSYIKKGDLTIAISTSGSSPAFAKYLKIYISKLIPSNIGEFLKQMKNFRKTMPKGGDRMKFLDNKAKEYINSWKKIY